MVAAEATTAAVVPISAAATAARFSRRLVPTDVTACECRDPWQIARAITFRSLLLDGPSPVVRWWLAGQSQQLRPPGWDRRQRLLRTVALDWTATSSPSPQVFPKMSINQVLMIQVPD
jgi:hypothetical protein